MSLGQIIDRFIKEYNKALFSTEIKKPKAYALYQVWKWVDENEKARTTVLED